MNSPIREYAKCVGHEIVGRLKRMPDVHYGMDNNHSYRLYIDEIGNEYSVTGNGVNDVCIVTKDGAVI